MYIRIWFLQVSNGAGRGMQDVSAKRCRSVKCTGDVAYSAGFVSVMPGPSKRSVCEQHRRNFSAARGFLGRLSHGGTP